MNRYIFFLKTIWMSTKDDESLKLISSRLAITNHSQGSQSSHFAASAPNLTPRYKELSVITNLSIGSLEIRCSEVLLYIFDWKSSLLVIWNQLHWSFRGWCAGWNKFVNWICACNYWKFIQIRNELRPNWSQTIFLDLNCLYMRPELNMKIKHISVQSCNSFKVYKLLQWFQVWIFNQKLVDLVVHAAALGNFSVLKTHAQSKGKMQTYKLDMKVQAAHKKFHHSIFHI